MTDKELLTLAAKAAGDEIQWDGVEACWYVDNAEWNNPEWNPLVSDGDALRLAVKLGLSIITGTYKVVCEYIPQEDGGIIMVREHLNSDTYSATRRAIVRAASEIGKEIGHATD